MAQSDLLDFLERHADSASPHLAAARVALHETDCESSASTSTVPCAELLRIYSVRANHLATVQTTHAAQLQREVAALCVALERAAGHAARFFRVTLSSGRTFVFVEDTDTLELLGTIASHDARKLSDEDWRRVWGHGRPRTPES